MTKTHTRLTSAMALTLTAAILGAPAMSDTAHSCDPSSIGPVVPSDMNLRYAGRYENPLPAILSQGEMERLAAAKVTYAQLAPKERRAIKAEWRTTLKQMFEGTLPNTVTGASNEPTFDLLRAAAPQMLARLKACGPAADPRLAYLVDIPLGNNAASAGEE